MTLMPTLISLCQETTDKGTSNISYYYVHSTGSKFVPLDMWTGGHYPYICKLDFIDSISSLQVGQPSNSFYITDSPDSPSKIRSQDNITREFSDDPAASSSSASATSANETRSAPSEPDSASSAGGSRNDKSGSGISSGAIAGAVIAALIGGGLITGAAVFFWLRRQQSRQVSESTASQDTGYESGMMKDGFLEAQEDVTSLTAELANPPRIELGDGRRESRASSPG
ncbi:MAG: hypothetical protein L6R40_007703 [Gallowayella cf. fulva]|nr:MAG: hypothetical protein L6R40_007703 [Xanthomendoza cf. fulva]